MTHSGGKPHAVGDRGQRFEVSFFNPDTNKRQALGWTNDAESARRMADGVDAHPSWDFPWVTDRHAHTPGPWEWWTSNSFRRLSAGGKDGAVLSAVVMRDGHPDIQVNEADALLIEHAPALLAALRDLLRHCDTDSGGETIFERDVIAARKAIAKATGTECHPKDR